MADDTPLVRAEPVPRMDLGPRPARSPGTKVVYATAEGELEVLQPGQRLRWMDRQFGRYRTRYEVDVSDHFRTVQLGSAPPPARGGVYKFSVVVTVGFRVFDPVMAVANEIGDGMGFVAGYLLHNCRQITLNFEIEDSVGAERAINGWFQSRAHQVGGGIEVFSVAARVDPDAEAIIYIKAKQKAQWAEGVADAEHEKNANDVRRDGQLRRLQQSTDMAIREAEADALAGREMTAAEVARIHLERNPTDTAAVLGAIVAGEQTAWARGRDEVERQQSMTRYLIEHEIIRDIDTAQQFLGKPATPAALGTAPSWDTPLPGFGQGGPGSATPPPADTSAPAGGGPAGGGPGAGAPPVIPVYMVIDESMASADVVDELNAGLDRIYRGLAEQPDIARAVRLAVVGYSDTVGHHVPLAEIDGAVAPPRMVAGGRARYAAAFAHLLDCIPRDAEILKQGSSSVRRPQVLFLTASLPGDTRDWAAPHAQLVDRRGHRYAPDILAFGVGDVPASTIRSIATDPHYGFVATDRDPRTAIRDFFEFARRHILAYGEAVLRNDSGPNVAPPPGFHAVIEGSVGPEPRTPTF